MLLNNDAVKTTYSIISIIDKTIFVINPIKAPFPADLALLGFLPSYIRNRIKPTSGMKKPKSAKPKLELSSEIF
jgi:hypothetical protein